MIDKFPHRHRKRRRKVTLKTETHNTIKSLIITLTIMIVVLTIVSLVTTSKNSQLGYTLQQEKLKNEDLRNQKQQLNSQISTSTTTSEIIEGQKLKEMAAPETKTYVTEEDNKVK